MFCLRLLRGRQPPRILSFLRHNSFLNGPSTSYIEDMYNAWLKDPKSVHPSWDSYFRHGNYNRPPTLAPLARNEMLLSQIQPPQPQPQPQVQQSQPKSGDSPNAVTLEEHINVMAIINSLQARGHLVAKLDPLSIMFEDRTTTISDQIGSIPREISRYYNVDNIDKNKVFKLPMTTFIGGGSKELPLHEIIRRLEMTYCRHIGVEYIYLENFEERAFIRQKLEPPAVSDLTPDQRRLTLARLIRATEFEAFLAKKWVSEKRFGLEGCDMLIPAIKQIIDRSSDSGVDHFVIGVAHRGRLNILANVCRKPLYQLFTQFASLQPEEIGSGDVKYHLGAHIERLNRVNKRTIKVSVIANPSHLEAVNGVVLGRARAEQFYRGDTDGRKVMAVLIHGDASFSGEGVVYETMHLSALPCYNTHGVIHIVLNNQIGFTTDPRHSRSSRYCSDVGHVVNAPIFHVNADDPDSVIHVANVAAEWRAKFHKDIVIDLVGYRRNGHNEADEPMFTQPLMYTKIKNLKPIMEKYSKQLIDEKIVTAQEVKETKDSYVKLCDDEFKRAGKETQIRLVDWLDSPWTGFFEGKDPYKLAPTGVAEKVLLHIGKRFSAMPPPEVDFVVHKGIERILKARQEMINARRVDWSLGEAMAFGSLLKDGIHVRLSGQDVERGTFSHRHHVLHHQTVDKATYNSLTHLYPDQAPYVVCNSSLSECGVLSFETGFSMTNPNQLVMWEAQFGDFANNAHTIFDQFLSSGQMKWVRQTGLVVLLPHGYEGMGPEHSSARVERFLQMCDDDPEVIPPEGAQFAVKQLHDCNWIIANCTTPANMFHILRRQIALPFRKPLIICTPKSLLRHPEARSSFDEMLEGTEFRRVIPEEGEASKSAQNVKKLILCSGKVYYDMTKVRREKKLEREIAIARVEQISPFPYDLIRKECEKYAAAKVCWVQEEPKNAGGYTYVVLRMQTLLEKKRELVYVGRPPAAATATGSKAQHYQEVENLLRDAIAL